MAAGFDDQIRLFICIVHFVLSRHFEYGRDLCFDLLQESAIQASPSKDVSIILSPDRMTIAIEAILLTINVIEREETNPTWPTSSDFTTLPALSDYPSSSDVLPPAVLSKPNVQELLDRCGATMGVVAVSCAKAVGSMSIFDDQWAASRVPAEEAERYKIIQHPDGPAAYPIKLTNQILMLRVCFQSWPRCLPALITSDTAIEILIHSVVHIEPLVADAAVSTLKRMMADSTLAIAVLSQFTSFLFDPRVGSGVKMAINSPRLHNLWASLVDMWVAGLMSGARTGVPDDVKRSIPLAMDQIEAGSLFMMTLGPWPIHQIGVTVARMMIALTDWLRAGAPNDDTSTHPLRAVDLLQGKNSDISYLQGFDELLEQVELDRLEQWRKAPQADLVLRLADSDHVSDRKIWHNVFPIFLRHVAEYPIRALVLLREIVTSAVSKYHPLIVYLAGLSPRIPVGVGKASAAAPLDGAKLVRDNRDTIDQWLAWVKVLSSTAIFTDTRGAPPSATKDHSRALSDADFEKERLTTTKGIYQYVAPFLDSEFSPFRTAAVFSLTFFQAAAYPALLEDLNAFASRQLYDELRPKTPTSSGERTRRQERLHTAVGRAYYLTASQLPLQRAAGKQAALMHVLKFVRNTQTFLSSPENRDNHTFQRLRRYFCGAVERLFDALSLMNDSDRFLPRNIHLALYRLCEDWCQLGAQSDAVKHRLIVMQRAASTSASDMGNDAADAFLLQTRRLSHASVGALASLLVSDFALCIAFFYILKIFVL